MKISEIEKQQIGWFLDCQIATSYTRLQWEQSYRNWHRGGRGWWPIQQGGTGQMKALMWYQHRHRPGSREWRPAIIIRALIEAAQQAWDATEAKKPAPPEHSWHQRADMPWPTCRAALAAVRADKKGTAP